MATNERERQRAYEKRELRLEKMRNQIASGDLTVRQMTNDERARWNDRSAAAERDATPEERARRESALRARAHRTKSFGRSRAPADS